MKRKCKATTGSQKRLLDCTHYSRCLMEAAQSCSSGKHFSCSMCHDYRQERVTDEDRVIETIRALRLFDAVWKESDTRWAPV